jgi:hypothetical protein
MNWTEQDCINFCATHLGCRYKVVDDGFIIYANAWTLLIDLFKRLFNKL